MNDFLTLSRFAFRNIYGLNVEPDQAADFLQVDPWVPMAHRHRMVGLWAAGLPSVGSELHRLACGQMVHSTRLTVEAERIAGQLVDRLGHVRMVKGPALAAQAWPELGLRSFDDLDFRCEKKDLPQLTEVLKELGYQPQVEDSLRRQNLWNFGWGIGFTHPDRFLVEFNHRMFPPHYPWPRRLTSRTSKHWKLQHIDQLSIDCPDSVVHLLLCCSHAIWHGWERLSWVVDIAGLLVRFPGLFAEADRLASGHSFLRRSLHTGCCVANRIFGPLLDAESFENVSSEWVDQACDIMSQQPAEGSFEFQRQIHHQLMAPMESALYTARRILIPGDPDFKKWPLPAYFRGLYWPLRPLRCLSDRLIRRRKVNL